LICDYWVYKRRGGDFEVIQSLDKYKGVSTGASLTKDLLILGHTTYSRVSLWKWHEQSEQYILIKSTKVLRGIGGPTLSLVGEMKLLKRDPFSEENNELYCVLSLSQLHKFKILFMNTKEERAEGAPPRNVINKYDDLAGTIVNYTLLSKEFMIILYTKKLTVMRIHPEILPICQRDLLKQCPV
jgi:hypothetical protein